MDKQQFDDAIGAVPPSTVDVDAIITRQRRAAMVRWVAAPGVTAAAAVVVVTFGIVIALPSGSGDGGGTLPASQPGATRPTAITPHPPSTTSQHPPARRPPCAQGAAETVPVAAARLSATLTAAVRRQIPSAELSANSAVNFDAEHQFGPLEFFHVASRYDEYDFDDDCMERKGYFMAVADVSDAAGTGSIHVELSIAGSEDLGCGNPQLNRDLFSCAPGTGPNGETYVASTGKFDQEGAPYHQVDVVRPDGTSGSLRVYNLAGDFKEPQQPGRPQPPLTLEQLVAVALDPGLTLFASG